MESERTDAGRAESSVSLERVAKSAICKMGARDAKKANGSLATSVSMHFGENVLKI